MINTRIQHVALLILMLFNSPNATFAQIDTIATDPANLWMINSLGSNGPKICRSVPTGVQLLNPDLTLYRTLTYPALPLGYHTDNPILYVTESLFDNDPATIEFMLSVATDTAIWPKGVVVGREDGSTLYFASNYGLNAGYFIQWDPLNVSAPIVDSPNGALMLLTNGTPPGTLVLQLPGHLPCIECNGSAFMGTGGHYAGAGVPNLIAFPNPTSNDATIRYDLPVGTTKGSLVFYDTQGQEVKRLQVNGSGTKHITTADMAAGTYLYQVETERGVMGAKRLVVVK